jgi:hypothetical protein
MLIQFSPMKLDPKVAVEADIFCWGDGKPWRGPTWPLVDGVAIILCPDCGEIEEDARIGDELGVQTPVHHFIYAALKLYAGGSR